MATRRCLVRMSAICQCREWQSVFVILLLFRSSRLVGGGGWQSNTNIVSTSSNKVSVKSFALLTDSDGTTTLCSDYQPDAVVSAGLELPGMTSDSLPGSTCCGYLCVRAENCSHFNYVENATTNTQQCQFYRNHPPDFTRAVPGCSFYESNFGATRAAATEFSITVDNVLLNVFVDGVDVSANHLPYASYWDKVDTILIAGSARLLAVRVQNGFGDPASAGEGGFITEGRVLTGSNWKCIGENALNAQPGWMLPEYDDSSWPTAHVIGNYGIGPWNDRVTPSMDSQAKWIWTDSLLDIVIVCRTSTDSVN